MARNSGAGENASLRQAGAGVGASCLVVSSRSLIEIECLGTVLEHAARKSGHEPEVADALESDSHLLLVEVPSISVAEAADLLGQSRPTIHERWTSRAIKASS